MASENELRRARLEEIVTHNLGSVLALIARSSVPEARVKAEVIASLFGEGKFTILHLHEPLGLEPNSGEEKRIIYAALLLLSKDDNSKAGIAGIVVDCSNPVVAEEVTNWRRFENGSEVVIQAFEATYKVYDAYETLQKIPSVKLIDSVEFVKRRNTDDLMVIPLP